MSVDVLGGDHQNLGGGGHPRQHLLRAVVPQGAHTARRDRVALDSLSVGVLDGELSRDLVDDQELVDGGPALVSVPQTDRTTALSGAEELAGRGSAGLVTLEAHAPGAPRGEVT